MSKIKNEQQEMSLFQMELIYDSANWLWIPHRQKVSLLRIP